MTARQTHRPEIAAAAAETAPLLGHSDPRVHGLLEAQPVSINGDSPDSGEPENNAGIVEDGDGPAEIPVGSGDIQKPKVKMAALLPALAIGVSLRNARIVTSE